jgi:nucleoside-diphosphate-sugar epimerase
MHIPIIGGTAFIGREIVRHLVGRGREVWVLHRKDHHDLGAGVHNLRADLDAVRAHLRQHAFNVVCDNACDFERGTAADVVGATVRACAEDLHRYVFTSSIAVYDTGFDHREDDALAPDDHPNPYVAQKAASERALFALSAERGLPVTTFRPQFVHGPNQPFYREQFFWDRLVAGRPVILPDGREQLMQ